MPRTSLTSLEILLRQVKQDADLDAYPEVRANLRTRIRSLAKRGLDQDEQDVAVGLVLNRRDLLLSIPSGRLKRADALNGTVRVQEQLLKATNALRRRGGRAVPTVGGRRRPVPTRGSVMRRAVPTAGQRELDDEELQEAGDEPVGEANDDAAEAAGGGSDG